MNNPIPQQHRFKAAVGAGGGLTVGAIALLLHLLPQQEGLVTHAYPDPATGGPPWTICYGETDGVYPGERKSKAECLDMLKADLPKYYAGVTSCVHVPMSDHRIAAVVSIAYNIGIGGFCRSSIARDLNQGRDQEACDAFMLYDRANGRVFEGLRRRREIERQYCLE